MTHYVRIVHKPKRSHHKAMPGKGRVNLVKPKIARSASQYPVPYRFRLPDAIYREAVWMRDHHSQDSALLGLWFLREYRMAHKFWECIFCTVSPDGEKGEK